MTKKRRYLTKSRFKLGCECPTKLYYNQKPEYGNTKVDDKFLEALAAGGFQVGELAKLYYEGGHFVETLDSEEALKKTAELLRNKEATIYEAALSHEDLLVRVDILTKSDKKISLIEVKAKSYDSSLEDCFYDKNKLKKGKKVIVSTWQPYLYDIAFQTYVAKLAYPQFVISSKLMLADKNSVATVDGLNQNFVLKKDPKGRTSAMTRPGLKKADLGKQVLVEVDVNEPVSLILEQGIDGVPFGDIVNRLAQNYVLDQKLPPKACSTCKSCEFNIGSELKSESLKSGFEECWREIKKNPKLDFSKPTLFEIWNYRKTEELLDANKFFLSDLKKADIDPQEKDEPGISGSERQWLQVQKVLDNDNSEWIDIDGLKAVYDSFNYPLHFIDFETTMAAIPFNKGLRPYEQVAFQFSHHILTRDGRIEHKDQYINQKRGDFPNFDFVRALKKSLETDQGTIFRYAAHENTILCHIAGQLHKSQEPDREELIAWIKTITKATGDSKDKWEGPRKMIDLCELVKKYYYHPYTKGSNSIKKVLPAILQTSQFLHQKYGQKNYGASAGVKSLNFENWQWLQKDSSGKTLDPYKLLPQIFEDLSLDVMDRFFEEDLLADGGAAMTAYLRMQFTEMRDEERAHIVKALLKYCELDTFAMVMIFEHWQDILQKAKSKKVA